MTEFKKAEFIFIPTEDIELIRDKSSPIYDPRVERKLDEFQIADYKERGQTTPIRVATRENLAQFGVHLSRPFTPVFGRGRRLACGEVGIPFMSAEVCEYDSLAAFLTDSIRENTNRDDESYESLIVKATRLHEMGVAIDSICVTLRKPESTVKGALKIAEIVAEEPAVAQMVSDGLLTAATASVLTSGTSPEERAVIADAVQELVKETLQEVASTGELPKKGSPVSVTVTPEGEVAATPTHATMTDLKAAVKGKVAPSKTEKAKAPKTEKAAEKALQKAKTPVQVVLDKALAQQVLARATSGERAVQSPDFWAGFRAAIALAQAERIECPADASPETTKAYGLLFPAAVAVAA